MYTPSKADVEKMEKAFTYHAPKDDQAERYNGIRTYAENFALALTSQCPASRELSLALTHLEECVMWANAAIARNE